MDPFEEAIVTEIQKFPVIYSSSKCSQLEIKQAYDKIAENLSKKKGIFKYVTG